MQIGNSMRMESEKRMKIQKLKGDKGITLLSLIITVVIMLILAAVTINVTLGKGGIVDQAKHAAEQTANSVKSEQDQLEILEQEFANVLAEDSEFTPPASNDSTIPESIVGYYADTDGDGSVDGVIYADLAVGGSGEWGDEYDKTSYTIPKENNFKKYKTNGTYTTSGFGTREVVTVSNGNGNDRFHVMSLSDEKVYGSWYYYAEGNMNDYTTATSTEFGKGMSNTINIMEKWNNNEYGLQNENDIWRNIKSQVERGWYVPSKEEWAAFADALKITASNYMEFEILPEYWSSSQNSVYAVWNVIFGSNMFGYSGSHGENNVRLGTTF